MFGKKSNEVEKATVLAKIATGVAEDRLASAIERGTLPEGWKGTANDYMQQYFKDTEEAKLIDKVYNPQDDPDDTLEAYFRGRGF